MAVTDWALAAAATSEGACGECLGPLLVVEGAARAWLEQPERYIGECPLCHLTWFADAGGDLGWLGACECCCPSGGPPS